MTRLLLIESPSDASRLLDRSHRYARISVQTPGLSESERQHWQDEFAHHYSGCGCGIGSAFSLAGVVSAVLFLFAAHPAASLWVNAVAAFAIVVCFVVVGQLMGKLRADLRLRAAVDEFASVAASRPARGELDAAVSPP